MTQRMYEAAGLNIKEIEKSNVKELILNAGQLYNISGLIFQGNGKTFFVVMPNGDDISHIVQNSEYCSMPSIEELQAIIKRTDDPLIFEQNETGLLKTIVRKQQRVISGTVQQGIWLRDNYQCMFCGKGIADGHYLTVDHFMPLELGGRNRPDNYLTACRPCNKNKGSIDPKEYCHDNNLDYDGLAGYLVGTTPKSFIFHLGF